MEPITELATKVTSYFALLDQILSAAGTAVQWPPATQQEDRLRLLYGILYRDRSLRAKAVEILGASLEKPEDGLEDPDAIARTLNQALTRLESRSETCLSARRGEKRRFFPYEKERQRLIQLLFQDWVHPDSIERKKTALAAQICQELDFFPSFVEALADSALATLVIHEESIGPMKGIAARQRGCIQEVEQAEYAELKRVLREERLDYMPRRSVGVRANADVDSKPWSIDLKRRMMEKQTFLSALSEALNFPLPFVMVLDRELKEIQKSRPGRRLPRFGGAPPMIDTNLPADPVARAHKMNLLGLAFSGGGIRSATFNLGILHALAELRILRHVDYLSTVSGGGYIGSWLAAWTRRMQNIQEVEKRLCGRTAPNPRVDEVRPIRWLREFSNYLTPSTGFFSADTWTLVSIWFRNTLLNQLILISAIVSLLLLPRALHLFFEVEQPAWPWVAGAGVLALIASVIGIGINLNSYDALRKPPIQRTEKTRGWPLNWIQWGIIVPAAISALCVSWLMWKLREGYEAFSAPELAPGPFGLLLPRFEGVFWASWLLLAISLIVVTCSGRYWKCFRVQDPEPVISRAGSALFWIVCLSVVASGAGAAMFALLFKLYRLWSVESGPWLSMALGVPLIILVFAITALLHIGLLGINFPDERREWWSRLGAWLFICAISWAALYTVSIIGPLWIAAAGAWAAGAGATWIAVTAAGVKFANSVSTGPHASGEAAAGGLRDMIARFAPYIFIAGLLLAISWGIHLMLIWVHLSGDAVFPPLHELKTRHWALLDIHSYWLVAYIAAAALLALFLAWRIDVNEFAMHHFYKNRLVRCYLGASRRRDERWPNTFTGFDLSDDIKLARFQTEDPVLRELDNMTVTGEPEGWVKKVLRLCGLQRQRKSRELLRREELAPLPPSYVGPLPVVNTALNVTKGEDLAWQERKAESFVFTPLYCGFEYVSQRSTASAARKDALLQYGFRPTRYYGYGSDNGIGIGTVVAISGAAANPNMGYHSSPAAAFLMTLFNVRLGWWLGNPRAECKWTRSSPRLGLFYLLKDLTGNTSNKSDYVSLSDGGHFENLGVYELVRRRCRYIIACDAEQDGDLAFGGLGNLIRRCRADFGIEIDINLDQIRRNSGKYGKAHCVVGDIHYPEDHATDPDKPADPVIGKLVYIKSSLTGEEPADILEYAARFGEFPHQSTGDQWFDESQFESYRKLGYHIGMQTFQSASEHYDLFDRSEQFFEHMSALWFPPTREIAAFSGEHASEYASLLEKLRGEAELASLDPSMFPGLDAHVSSLSPAERNVFLYCNILIQFMERIYSDLRMQEDREHPYIQGWLRIFQGWAGSAHFAQAWEGSKSTYSERFQRFYEDVIAPRPQNAPKARATVVKSGSN